MSLMATRIALHLPDDEAYSCIGLHRVMRSSHAVPGRGLLPGHTAREAQLALVSSERLTLAYGGTPPVRIRPLPTLVVYPGEPPRPPSNEAPLHLGLREGLEPGFARPASEHLLIAGPHGSGRSNALAVAVQELIRNEVQRIFVMNPRRAPLLRATALAGGCAYAEHASDLAGIWDAIAAECRQRFDTIEQDGDEGTPWAIVIDDAELAEPPPAAADALRQLVHRGVDVHATVIVATEPQAARDAYSFDALRNLMRLQSGILLRPSTTDDFAMFGVRGRPSRLPPGRGYACFGGERTAVQIYSIAE
jgi:S-DNA-T family DNA segregation ATPase FtsK/SpoIIIE